MELLLELNPDVSGDYVDESMDTILQENPVFFDPFHVIVATALTEKQIIALSERTWKGQIPFIFCRSVGFVATARIQVHESCVCEAHPDNSPPDLRLAKPFPSLLAHLESTELSHKVPWLVVLYKYLQKWRLENGDRLPENYKEKSALRDLIRSGMTKDEENYEEAIKAVNTCFGGGKPNAHLIALFSDPKCDNLGENVCYQEQTF